MTPAYLLTSHGTFLYHDVGTNQLRHGTRPGAAHETALIQDGQTCWLAHRAQDEWQRLDGLSPNGEIGWADPDGAPLTFYARELGEGLIGLEANGYCLCAESDGRVTLSRQIRGPWETFIAINEAGMDRLDTLRDDRFLLASRDVPVHITLQPEFRASAGPLGIPLNTLLTARPWGDGAGFTLRYQGWKIDQLIRFRPLIYLLAYGPQEMFDCLELALRSLWEFGRYDGEVLIFSDRGADQMYAFVPDELKARTRVVTAPARDVLDIMAVKYRIADVPGADAYRPLVYLDTDVICNRPVLPMLTELLQAHHVSLPLEHDFHAPDDFYGANLLAEDDIARRRDPRGMCAGLIGIPGIAAAERCFPAILDSLYARARALGTREPSPWLDQPAANYVLRKTGAVDCTILTARVVTPVDTTQPAAAIPRLGFAHFSGGVGDAVRKLPLMRAYLELLRQTP